MLGVSLAINDADNQSQKDPSALDPFGGIYPNKNSKKFGMLLLGDKP